MVGTHGYRAYTGISLVLATAAARAGEMNTTFVDRLVGASATATACGAPGDSEFVLNQALTPFSVSVDASHDCAAAGATNQATHVSGIGPRSVSGFGSCLSLASADESTTVSGQAFVLFMTNFELSAPTPYTLVGSIRIAGDVLPTNVAVALTGPGGTIQEFELFGPADAPGTISFSPTGVLPPGIYTLMGSATSSLDGFVPPGVSAEATFDLLLAMTDCLGDLDDDGQVGQGDLAVLLANYDTKSGAQFEDGDLDSDGDVDLADLARFLPYFGESCE